MKVSEQQKGVVRFVDRCCVFDGDGSADLESHARQTRSVRSGPAGTEKSVKSGIMRMAATSVRVPSAELPAQRSAAVSQETKASLRVANRIEIAVRGTSVNRCTRSSEVVLGSGMT